MDDIKILYSRIRLKYPDIIYIDQDEQYINWRIYKNPNVACKTYFLYEGDLLTGYCYMSVNQNKSSIITDFTFDKDEDGKILLVNVISELRNVGIYDIRFWGNYTKIAEFGNKRSSHCLKRSAWAYSKIILTPVDKFRPSWYYFR